MDFMGESDAFVRLSLFPVRDVSQANKVWRVTLIKVNLVLHILPRS